MVFSGGFDGENAVAVAEFDVVVFEEADLAEQTEAGAAWKAAFDKGCDGIAARLK